MAKKTRKKTPKKMGRKSKLCPAIHEKICAILRGGAYRQDACSLAGIHFATFARWMERGREEEEGMYTEFCESVERAEAEARWGPIQVMNKASLESPHYAERWLKMRWPDKFAEGRNTGEDATAEPIEIRIVGLPRPSASPTEEES